MEKPRTPYEEMCEVAKQARAERSEKNAQMKSAMIRLVNSLNAYCNTPADRVQYLRWDEDTNAFSGKENGAGYPLPHAVEYIEDKDECCLGVWMSLDRPGSFPAVSVAFGIFMVARDGELRARVGRERDFPVDPDDWQKSEPFFKFVVEQIKTSFKIGERRSRQFGFYLDRDQTQQGL